MITMVQIIISLVTFRYLSINYSMKLADKIVICETVLNPLSPFTGKIKYCRL